MTLPLPLAGLRVLTAEQYGAGPFGSMQLADLGAEVIKIENPAEGGDVARGTAPHLLDDGTGRPDSLFFQSFNRNKKSLTLDLKSPAGQAVFRRLVARSDAVMNNLRGDQPAKLGLTYDALKDVNPKIVCAHLSAYGRDNERTNWPGYDYLMQAEAGYLYLTGEPELRVTMPILNGFFTIPGGDPAYKAEFTYEVKGEPRKIFSVMPHMHLLGQTIDLRLDRGGEETCVARVDDWEFHWQQFYDLKPEEFLEVREGDILRYSCVFDNSAENQPIVDGEQQAPRTVGFGEGTLDEMCLNVVAMIEPFKAAPAAVCGGFGECFDQSCMPDDGACFLGCAVQEPEPCGGCVLRGTRLCTSRATLLVSARKNASLRSNQAPMSLAAPPRATSASRTRCSA